MNDFSTASELAGSLRQRALSIDTGAPIGFALCHGWAFDAQAMMPLVAALRPLFPDAEFALFDLGFGGHRQHPALPDDRRWIAIGHSYGYAWLMQQPVPWHAAIAINGFTRFCRHPGQSEGTPLRVLDAMLARLANDQAATVADFHARCGAHLPAPPELDAEALTIHLHHLRALELLPVACPTLALTTDDDLIVSPALARACFAQGQAEWRQLAGDHTSLLGQPAILAQSIGAWLSIKASHE
jgi:pimeloyl-[acyl-carrier protein] methyl ester esterase